MDRELTRRHLLLGGVASMSPPFWGSLLGCGSGGGGEVSPNNATEYRTWLNTTLVEQRKTVGDATANFVDLKTVTETNFTTSLVGWVRRASDSSVDQLWRWSSDPVLAQTQLALAVNRIGLAGTSISIGQSFDLKRDVGLSIPIIKSVLDFARTKSPTGSLSITIVYSGATVSWISDAALKLLLASSKLTVEFFDQISAGQVTLYRGVIALSGVKIQLKTSGTILTETKVNDVFTESGLNLRVESKISGSQSGEILLNVAGELFIGIDSRLLRAEDVGRKAVSTTTTLGGETVQQWVHLEDTLRIGTHILQNQSSRLITVASAVAVKYKDTLGNLLCEIFYFSDIALRPQSIEGLSMDLNAISFGNDGIIQSYILSGFRTDVMFPYAGIKGGSVFRRTESGNIPVIDGMRGVISADGKFLFHHYLDTRFVMEGTITSDYKLTVKSIFGDFTTNGTYREASSKYVEFPIPGTDYTGSIELYFGGCGPSSC